jgi:membrane protease YdiL (CAAX protease family)
MIRKTSLLDAALIGAALNIILTLVQRAILGPPKLSSAVSEFVSSASFAEHAVFLFLILVVVPFGEELIFRGLLWKLVKKIFNESKVVWIVATLFAFMHPLESAIFLFPFSVYLSHLRYTTESVRAGTVAHIAFNTAGIVFPSVVNWFKSLP